MQITCDSLPFLVAGGTRPATESFLPFSCRTPDCRLGTSGATMDFLPVAPSLPFTPARQTRHGLP